MLKPTFLGTLWLIAAVSGTAGAQEIAEIDTEAGRAIINDEWRSMYAATAVVDWTRGPPPTTQAGGSGRFVPWVA